MRVWRGAGIEPENDKQEVPPCEQMECRNPIGPPLNTTVIDEMPAYYDDRSERWCDRGAATDHLERR